jgi:Rrf2 family protein
VADLAARERIPQKFLELILLDLKNHGLLHSRRGRGGGYLLGKPPDAVALGQIIRILDGPLAPLPCVSQTAYRRCEECPDELTCGIRLVMKDVRDATARILDGTTLAQVLARVDTASAGVRLVDSMVSTPGGRRDEKPAGDRAR